LSEWTEILAALLLLIGTAFTLIGSIGLVRLPDFYTRMHAPTKATTLGVSGVLGAAALTLPGNPWATFLEATLAIVLLFITAPIGAHMLARAARHHGIEAIAETDWGDLPRTAPTRRDESQTGRNDDPPLLGTDG